jgi:hypothetical protein
VCLLAKLRNPSGLLLMLSQQPSTTWAEKIQRTAGLPWAAESVDELRAWALEAKRSALLRSSEAGKVASKSRWSWVDDQLRAGLGALHRLAKRATFASSKPVLDHGLPTLQLRQVFAADRETWMQVWERFKETATAPWRATSSNAVGLSERAAANCWSRHSQSVHNLQEANGSRA